MLNRSFIFGFPPLYQTGGASLSHHSPPRASPGPPGARVDALLTDEYVFSSTT